MVNERCKENKNLKPKTDRLKIIIMFSWIYICLRIHEEDVRKFGVNHISSIRPTYFNNSQLTMNEINQTLKEKMSS
jgi:hypothetical protein